MTTPTTPQAFVILDGRFTRTGGQPSSHHMGYAKFASRYLDGWPHITLVARVSGVEDPLGQPLAGPGVSVLPLPNVRGLGGLLRSLPHVLRLFWQLPAHAHYILRIPGFFPTIAWLVLMLRGQKNGGRFGVEVVADPADVFAPGTMRSRLRPLFRWVMVHLTRWQCRTASVSAFVTQHALQRRYPPHPQRPTFSYTSLNLPAANILASPRTNLHATPRRLICVANMAKFIKGQDTLLHAISQLITAGHQLHLTLVGDGDSRTQIETLTTQLGLTAHVTFAGKVAVESIPGLLDTAHAFILPSRQEGLPRAMLEAMARGLPCIATRVGGSDELLPADWLIAPNHPTALAAKITQLLALPATALTTLSTQNLATAARYTQPVVQAQRQQFYQALKAR